MYREDNGSAHDCRDRVFSPPLSLSLSHSVYRYLLYIYTYKYACKYIHIHVIYYNVYIISRRSRASAPRPHCRQLNDTRRGDPTIIYRYVMHPHPLHSRAHITIYIIHNMHMRRRRYYIAQGYFAYTRRISCHTYRYKYIIIMWIRCTNIISYIFVRARSIVFIGRLALAYIQLDRDRRRRSSSTYNCSSAGKLVRRIPTRTFLHRRRHGGGRSRTPRLEYIYRGASCI